MESYDSRSVQYDDPLIQDKGNFVIFENISGIAKQLDINPEEFSKQIRCSLNIPLNYNQTHEIFEGIFSSYIIKRIMQEEHNYIISNGKMGQLSSLLLKKIYNIRNCGLLKKETTKNLDVLCSMLWNDYGTIEKNMKVYVLCLTKYDEILRHC